MVCAVLQCGADHVKVTQSPPEGLVLETGMRYATVDGDGDRLLYFFQRTDGAFAMLDGDRIAALAAQLVGTLVRRAGLAQLTLGVVQTAYANGNATAYIERELVRRCWRSRGRFVRASTDVFGHGRVFPSRSPRAHRARYLQKVFAVHVRKDGRQACAPRSQSI